jgi:hypothetical protein
MKNKFNSILVTLSISALIFTGCSKLPQEEINAANAAIENAKIAGADVYVPESYIALEDSMSAVMVRIEAQNSKLIKTYSASKEELAGVTKFAEEVIQQTEQRKDSLKMEIQNTIAEVRPLIETNRQLITEAPKGKEGTTALVAIKGELSAIEVSLDQAAGMIESEAYLEIMDKASAAKAKAESINAELTQVIAKYKANVQGKKG